MTKKKVISEENTAETSDITSEIEEDVDLEEIEQPEPEQHHSGSEDEELLSYETSSIIINITLLPEDKECPGNRRVILSASTAGDPPVSRWLQEKDILPLPPALTDLINELIADFPNRQTRRKLKALKERSTSKNITATSSNAIPPTIDEPATPQNTKKQLTLW